jgi:ribosome-binding factor A
MSFRMNRINKHLQRMFGEVLREEVELPTDILVTVVRVETTHNLRSSTIWLSVFPAERGPDMLQTLQDNLYTLQGSLNRKLTIHPLPRIRLALDYGAHHAEGLERHFNELDQK